MVDKHLSHCQGGFRVGSGVKEQLWALLEFMEEGDNDEHERIFCTTDVHKAFDQVYRNGTVYLLYGMGVRGRMLHMIDQWISRNYAVQKWRGHTGNRVELVANGLRQGCTLSPLLYLVVINVLVSKEPGVSMPAWDEGYREYAYSSGVQNLEGMDLGAWMVYLFCDDTAFVAENPAMMDVLLNCYKTFTVRWRIRVNPGKCKVMYSELATITKAHYFGHSLINEVTTLKYLGYWIGRTGRHENDKHLIAQATQLRFKIRAVLPVLGEMLTLIYLESHETPRVLFGAELGSLTGAKLDTMHTWSLSEALGMGRYEASQGYTSREVAKAVVWADYEGSTWSQLRARNAKVLYRSVKRMGPDTAPAKRLRKQGHNNVLVDCFMKGLNGVLPAEDRQAAVNKCLRWNSSKEDQRVKWKEVESRLMGNENLIWRRGLIAEIVAKAEGNYLLSQSQRILNFGSGSTVYMQASVSTRGLEHTLSHTRTKVSTSTKLAARKIRGGRVRGMLVLAHMNTARWQRMDSQQRQQAVECPCGDGLQNVQHVLSGTCAYMTDWLDDLHSTVSGILQSEGESVQQRWLMARNMEEAVAALVNMDVRAVTPDALWEMGLSVKTLIGKVEAKLSAVNKTSESWPVECEMWAPEVVGPQIEAMPSIDCVQPSADASLGAAG